MIDGLSRDDLLSLMKLDEGICVSVYLSTYEAGAEVQQNPIRLKNLINQAIEKLVERGMRSPEAEDLLEPGLELIRDEIFWQHQSQGLALFLTPMKFRSYRLPLPFQEQVTISDRPAVKPLLSLFSNQGRYYILALSQNEVRLLEGTQISVRRLELGRFPKSLDEALKWDDPEKQLQYHTSETSPAGKPPVMFHGHGAGTDDAQEKNDILRFFHKVDRGLSDLLAGQRTPLVLAGVESLFPIYREANTYGYLVSEGIPGNPEEASDQELNEKAWGIVEPIFRRSQEEAVELYRRLEHTGRATANIAEIVPAAHYGRVEQLFIPSQSQAFGTFDANTGEIRLSEEEKPENNDLIEMAAVHTIANGGVVYTVQPDEMPASAACAAIFRY